jgi:Flp pilus assembly protein TadD
MQRPVALSGHGVLHFLRGDLEKAREIWERARRSYPRFVMARAWLVHLYSEQDDVAEARKVVDEILNYHPTSTADGIMDIIRLYYPRIDDDDKMLAKLRKAGLP